MQSTWGERIPGMTVQTAGRIERVLAFLAGAVLVLGLAYVLGASGFVGEAVMGLLDWLVAQGYVEGRAADVSLRWLHA